MKLLAGPCVIESEENIFKIAKGLEKYHNDSSIDFYFKSSFDKANRTSLESFRGLGMEEGLRILQKVKDDFGYKIVTDVHESTQVNAVAEVVDMLQNSCVSLSSDRPTCSLCSNRQRSEH